MAIALARSRQPDGDMFRSDGADGETLYQLRHQTKNLLQAITLTLADTHAETPNEIRSILQDLIRRVHVTAAMSDILFGATRPRSSFETVLRSLCEGVVLAFGRPECRVLVEPGEVDRCPERLQRVILRAAHEMVGNAVKHGWPDRQRRGGEADGDYLIRVRLRRSPDAVSLIVHDSGTGFAIGTEMRSGGGSRILDRLVRDVGGRVSRRNAHGAVVRLVVPLPARQDSRSSDVWSAG